MYRAKKSGKARHEVFEESMSAETRGRLKLENDLKLALERGEFRVYYQPEVDLESGRVVSMEALLRWKHPRRGLVPPLEFISLVEENGLIVPIGRWVLGQACRQALRWQQGHSSARPSVSVNLSARQLQQPGLTDTVAGILEETGLPPGDLILEITESLLVEDTERVSDTLWRLKDIGVELAIDDFGTGYSALSYLERFPVDYLKIDQSFVRKLKNGGQPPTVIMPLLVDLARTLGMKAVAEGVETAVQLKRLREIGCDMVQGHYFSEPLPVEAASEFLESSPET
jgi:EAL domain-containing protein (putative c-di-GMP-specific phosphodiesterase class I)